MEEVCVLRDTSLKKNAIESVGVTMFVGIGHVGVAHQ